MKDLLLKCFIAMLIGAGTGVIIGLVLSFIINEVM